MLGKIGLVGARLFHYEYSIMSRGFCQEKIWQNPEKPSRL